MKPILVLFLVGGLVFGHSFACLCKENVPASERLVVSDAVFLGKVIQVDVSQGGISGATFEIQQSWKGVFTKHVHVGASLGTSCNYVFMKDQTYLVYAYGKESIDTDLCSGTKLLADSYDDLRFLGVGKTPTVEDSPCIDNKCMEASDVISQYDLQNIIILSTISIPTFGLLVFLIWIKNPKTGK